MQDKIRRDVGLCGTNLRPRCSSRATENFPAVRPPEGLAGAVMQGSTRRMRIVMNCKAGLYALAAVVMLATGPAWAGCSATDRIDGTTADMAKHKIEAAGYNHVTDLSKGCDNYWHAIAMKDGASIGVVVSPTGEVMTEGS